MLPITAVLTQGEIIVPSQNDADSLYQDGYGFRKHGEHCLHPVEVLFNVEREKIAVIDEVTNKQLSFTDLLGIFSIDTPSLWTRFIVFKDLRTRGFIIKIDDRRFLVYERGTYKKTPPSYLIHIFSEGKPQKIDEFLEELSSTETQGYEMKVAVVDRRGELVYYTVKETGLEKE
jgi:tRNA-intron endonuclease